MAKKKDLTSYNEIFVAQKLAEDELNTNEINEPLERLDFKSFDSNKELLDYQQQALINAFRMLVAYFRDFKENKKEFYAFYQEHYSFANCDFTHKKLNHLLKSHFKVENQRVGFENFINRLAFYMATGSGKTIVIIKLVELLSVAIRMGLIPKKNIMFFSANENLIKQFEKEIEKYNRGKDFSKQIDFKNLKEVTHKDFHRAPKDFFEKIALFYYRTDLMNDEESKENLLNYKDYWDNGENYVILDEAHKGNKSESKRQAIFSLLSLKGFLFNFSATFTEESDLITAVYNLSVGEWVKLGYGKESVLLKKNNLNAFKDLKECFNWMSEKHFILKHEIYDPKDYEQLKKMIQKEHFKKVSTWHYKDLDYMISEIKGKLYPNQKVPKDEFNALDNEKIVHFKRIKVKADKQEELIKTIQEVKEHAPLDKETLRIKIAQGEIDPYDAERHKQDKTFKVDDAELLKLKEHYYTPLIKAKDCDWLKHVVKVKSEIDFLQELQDQETTKTLQENYDFWAFSKIDEHLDNLFIPYIGENATERKFFPDFIFWLQKGDTQIICFIDPKGTEHTSSLRKADVYKLFKDKIFNPKNDPHFKIKVVLKFYGDKDRVPEDYRDYWIKKGKLNDFFLTMKS